MSSTMYNQIKSRDENTTESNQRLINYVLDHTTSKNNGRLVMPLLGNSRVCNSLSNNFYLVKQILTSRKKW